MAEIKIEPEEVRAALVDVLQRTIPAEQRERLIRDAIAELIQKRNNWDTTELQQQYRYAVQNVAREVFQAEFQKPERVAAIQELVTEAFARLFEKDFRDKLVEQLATGIGKALTGDRY